jgi:hypothetical protein
MSDKGSDPRRARRENRGDGEPERTAAALSIAESPPRAGDVHHVSPDLLREALRSIPDRYHRGLAAIALAPRRNDIGQPYGAYDPVSKEITLFSAPAGAWAIPGSNITWRYGFEQWGASVKTQDNALLVHWKRGSLPCFYITVLCHQLAQHFNHSTSGGDFVDIVPATNDNLSDFHSLKLLLLTNSTFVPIKQALQAICDRLKSEE